MFKLDKKFWLGIFFAVQLAVVFLVATAVWPQQVAYFLLLPQLLAIILLDAEYALYSVIISLPFYLILPNPYFDTLAAWRPVFLALFLKVLWFSRRNHLKINIFEWDKYLKYLLVVAFISLTVAEYKIVGLKKILFVFNAYFLYFAVYNILHTKEQLFRAIRYALFSCGTIIALGYIQYLSTFFTAQYYFWQYWATFISRAFYGNFFADTAAYSNSWFSYTPNSSPTLRMFSVLPSSHAFAAIIVLSIPFMLALIRQTDFFKKQKIFLWLFCFLQILALLLSGTRGVWVGVLAPLVLLAYLYFKHFGSALLKLQVVPYLIFILLLFASPLLQKALISFSSRGGNVQNFLQKAGTIYDLSESSNRGRLLIWRKTVSYIATRPLLGAGFGNFITSLQPAGANTKSYAQLAASVEKTYNLPEKYITGHSLYLDIFAELGLVGMLFFGYYIFSITKKHYQFFKKYYLYFKDPLVVFTTGFALSFVWIMAYSIFDGTLLSDRVLMYFFLSLAISASIMRAYHKQNNA